MQIELFNRSKYRSGEDPGDDVSLMIPDRVYGVFDGATDAHGTRIDGVSAGRVAALVVAAEMAALAQRHGVVDMDGSVIIHQLAAALRRKIPGDDLPIPPSTTAAVVLDCGEAWRFLLLGDTGLRLNGTEVFQHKKLIDDVSTIARIGAFDRLLTRIEPLDEVEAAARTCILLGFDNAIREGLLTKSEVENIIEVAIRDTGLSDHATATEDFLRGGIQTQYRFGNGNGNPLYFDTLNGTPSALTDLQDIMRPKSEVSSIELFTDGYDALGDKPNVASWEAAFAQTEVEDFHRKGRFANVKGSTTTQFHDDRSLLLLSAS